MLEKKDYDMKIRSFDTEFHCGSFLYFYYIFYCIFICYSSFYIFMCYFIFMFIFMLSFFIFIFYQFMLKTKMIRIMLEKKDYDMKIRSI